MQTKQATKKQKNYNIKNNNITKVRETLLEILLLLLLSKNRTISNNILYIQKSIVVKLKNCSQNLLNKI